jgi:hypothetical protein
MGPVITPFKIENPIIITFMKNIDRKGFSESGFSTFNIVNKHAKISKALATAPITRLHLMPNLVTKAGETIEENPHAK